MGAKFVSVMSMSFRFLNRTVASAFAIVWFCHAPVMADEARLDRLYAQLQEADPNEALRLAREIEREWETSGSSSMDLLLKRGTDALEAGDTEAAIEHFTALTDHAPDFAEGWHRRSLAYAEVELFGPAVADIDRTLELRPRHYDAIATLGGILVQITKLYLAVEAFEHVLAIHPHHPDVTEALYHLSGLTSGMDL